MPATTATSLASPLPHHHSIWSLACLRPCTHCAHCPTQASNGASDYGNKFGEPVVHGFVRSFGQRLPGGERSEYVKPIMFSAGIGQMSDAHIKKGDPEVNLLFLARVRYLHAVMSGVL